MPTTHADNAQHIEKIGSFFREVQELGLLSDQDVDDAATYQDLYDAFETNIGATTLHADVKNTMANWARAFANANELNILTDTAVDDAATVDEIIDLFGSTFSNSANRDNFLP